MKRRLLFFGIKSFPSRGGTDRVAENLIQNLKDEYDITLFCYRDPQAAAYIPGVRIIQFRPLAANSVGALIYYFFSSLRALTIRTDLVHVHKTDCALFIPLLALRHKVVATSHEAPYKRDKWNLLERLYFRIAERIFIRTPHMTTCISMPLTAYYNNRYGGNVRFIPNGINPAESTRYDTDAAKAFLPQGADINSEFVLFSARRLMSTKGCHTLLSALRQLKYTGQIFIAGETDHHQQYIEELMKLSSGLRVYFLGFVHPLPALLALVDRSSIFVFPSETEGMSIMLLEVASTGRCIVASNIPENTQVFSPDEVIYFTNKDSRNLAQRLQWAWQNPERCAEIGAMARKKVHHRFNWENISLEYSSLYRQLIG